MAITWSDGPPKFWDYTHLHGELGDAVLKHVDSCVGNGTWEKIHFTLHNQEQYPYEIQVIFREKPAEQVAPTAEIDQIVRLMVDLLSAPPRSTWKRLNVRYSPPGSGTDIISLSS